MQEGSGPASASTGENKAMAGRVLRVRVTLKGRPVRAFTFNQDRVTVGRDPGADLVLDNPGISREHAKIEMTTSGVYRITDLESANGIFVNDLRVKVHYIINHDVVFVGKFALWFMYEDDRRGEQNDARRLAQTQDEGTTVLRTSELQEMIESLREAETTTASATATAVAGAAVAGGATSATATPSRLAPYAPSQSDPRRVRSLVALGLLLAFAAGYVTGGGRVWLPWRDGLDPLAGAISRLQPQE